MRADIKSRLGKLLTVFLAAICLSPTVNAEGILSHYISSAFESGIISGDESSFFDADKPAERAEFAAILTRFLNISGGTATFSDVPEDSWFFAPVAAAEKRGLLFGDGAGNFRPHEFISLSDAVTAIGRYYRAESENLTGTDTVPDYAKSYYSYALENNLFYGCGNTSPQNPATKGDILALLFNYDKQSTARVRFLTGYPKASQSCAFGTISAEFRTNKPCTVYYGLAEHGNPYYTVSEKLCEVTELNKSITVNIPADINKRYDLYLKPVNSDGVPGSTAVIKNLIPFSISSGDGTKSAPYIIYTGRQLLDIDSSPSSHFRLENNIELTDIWQPLSAFSGTLDGNGYEISGLKIDSEKDDEGLFSRISGTVKNLSVSAEISAKKNVGIICGTNSGEIFSCRVSGTADAKTNASGGICGVNNGTVTDCLSALESVRAGSFAGGIAGQNYGTIKNCLSACETVASDMYAGAVSGSNENGVIKSCVAVCMTVYDTMTLNSGRLTTNKKNGICSGNYCYDDTISNAAYTEESEFSQNGTDAAWDELVTPEFYYALGWDSSVWALPKNGYRLICPKSAVAPTLEAGKTAYFPLSVNTEEELRAIGKNEAGHYILSADIYLTMPWKTVFTQSGFSGTFDGNGHTVYNLNLKSESGMFSNITGGTVRNLILRGASASPGSGGAILAACNYGYIENCAVYASADTKKAGLFGAVAGENHGEISDCTAVVNINIKLDNAVIGGICGENSGIVIGSSYRGSIVSKGASAVIGGICGYNTEGYIFENHANAAINASNTSSYIGGVCGITSGGQIYKCSASGTITSICTEGLYTGGICALSESSAIYNCLSVSDIYSAGESGFAGGVCGYISASNIQNTYSAASVTAPGKVSAGGICGYAENGFVMQNAALNPSVSSGGATGGVIGDFSDSEVSDNFTCDRLLIGSKRVTSSAKNGIVKTFNVLKSAEMYFKPLSSGGSLGWDSDVWESVKGYPYPVLSGVPYQNTFKTPTYK